MSQVSETVVLFRPPCGPGFLGTGTLYKTNRKDFLMFALWKTCDKVMVEFIKIVRARRTGNRGSTRALA